MDLNVESEEFDVMYEGLYNFDDYTSLFARGLYNKLGDNDKNLLMLGIKASY